MAEKWDKSGTIKNQKRITENEFQLITDEYSKNDAVSTIKTNSTVKIFRVTRFFILSVFYVYLYAFYIRDTQLLTTLSVFMLFNIKIILDAGVNFIISQIQIIFYLWRHAKTYLTYKK